MNVWPRFDDHRSSKPPVYLRERRFPSLALFLAALTAVPWPLALATIEAYGSSAPVVWIAQLESTVTRHLKAPTVQDHTPLDSTVISAVTGVEEEDEDGLPVFGLISYACFYERCLPAVASQCTHLTQTLAVSVSTHIPLRC